MTSYRVDGDCSTPHLHIDAEPEPDGSIRVALTGELDGEEVDFLRSTMADVVRHNAPAPIHVDAGRLTFVDSAGIRALLTCRRTIDQAGSRMSIPRVSPNVFQVLEITGLLDVLGVVEQVDELRAEPRYHRTS
ncbi:STAS domain-containing protein [Actinoplanes sp. GCM10030250]|uniref:STAS domain-containing protein n=1 Tax=Actinoplanes sp. GCM10030250 TaxID=3273376 RepID=UPI0036068520